MKKILSYIAIVIYHSLQFVFILCGWLYVSHELGDLCKCQIIAKVVSNPGFLSLSFIVALFYVLLQFVGDFPFRIVKDSCNYKEQIDDIELPENNNLKVKHFEKPSILLRIITIFYCLFVIICYFTTKSYYIAALFGFLSGFSTGIIMSNHIKRNIDNKLKTIELSIKNIVRFSSIYFLALFVFFVLSLTIYDLHKNIGLNLGERLFLVIFVWNGVAFFVLTYRLALICKKKRGYPLS